MKLVVQRVSSARVTIHGQQVGCIERGAVILIGIAKGDTPSDAAWLARKVSQLRIYNDAEGRLNSSLDPQQGGYLVVSQFTLYGDCRKGNRPSYIESAPPDEAEQLYEQFVHELKASGYQVETGRFQEQMVVELANDGPITLLLESRGREKV